MPDESLHRTIELLYGAAMEPQRWSDALAAVADETDSWFANLLWLDKSGGSAPLALMGGDYPRATLAPFVDYYHKIDPRVKLCDMSPVGNLVADYQHFDTSFIARDETYQDLLLPYSIGCSAAARLVDNGKVKAILGVMRSTRQGPFAQDNLARLRLLLPHVTRAGQIMQKFARLEMAGAFSRGALDMLDWPVILTDGDARVIQLNRAAERMVSAGADLQTVAGRLAAPHADDDAHMRKAIQDCGNTAGSRGHEPARTVALCRAPPRPPLLLTIAPLPLRAAWRFGHGEAAVVLYAADPERPSAMAQIAQLFGLTRAEARLADGLARGLTLDAIAERHGLSKNTIRVQARAVFAKTGCRRQAELVRLLSSLTPVLPLPDENRPR